MKKKKRADLTKLNIQVASIKLLEKLKAQSRYGGGRFGEIRKQILSSIIDCPKNEIRVIRLTKELQADKKERQNIQLAVGKDLKTKGWKMRYAKDDGVFFLFRETKVAK